MPHLADAARWHAAHPHAVTVTTEWCVSALQAEMRAQHRRKGECVGWSGCATNYSLAIVNCSSSGAASSSSVFAINETAHRMAMMACDESARHRSLSFGGWCLTQPTNATHGCDPKVAMRQTECFMSEQPKSSWGVGRNYYLPSHHYSADARMARLLMDLLKPKVDEPPRYSLADFGAGVGQMCSALHARDRRIRCSPYDGAGNVEAATGGLVKWVDLTAPLSLGRSDWVVSFEVGEHVPNELEPMFVRNLHAHNCRGIVISWGWKQPGRVGHDDVNYHPKAHLVELFGRLGYRLRTGSAEYYLHDEGWSGPKLNPRHFWFDHNLVGIFDRITPVAGCE